MDVTKEFTDLQFLHILQKAFQSNLITDAMCKRVTAIKVIDKDINNLSGIEYFENLEYLNIAYNNVKELDLSKNTKLSELYCYKNDIIILKLPKIHMQVVSIYGNNRLLNIDDCRGSAEKIIIKESQMAHKKTNKSRERRNLNKKGVTI